MPQHLLLLRTHPANTTHVEEFLQQYTSPGEGMMIRASALYGDYLIWTKRRDAMPVSSALFGRVMGQRYKRVRTRDGKYYCGVGQPQGDSNAQSD